MVGVHKEDCVTDGAGRRGILSGGRTPDLARLSNRSFRTMALADQGAEVVKAVRISIPRVDDDPLGVPPFFGVEERT